MGKRAQQQKIKEAFQKRQEGVDKKSVFDVSSLGAMLNEHRRNPTYCQ